MILATCSHESTKKHGKDRKGNQRYRCCLCGETWIDRGVKPLGDMRISMREAVTVVKMLVEGISIRTIERITGTHRDTICDLILHVGDNCQRLLDAKVRNVATDDVQLDELWAFVGCKEKTRIARGYSAELGDTWTFIALDRDTKLILAHQVGQRDAETCKQLLNKLNRATSGRFQLSTDGLGAYTQNVPFVLGSRVDFAQLIKTYQSQQEVTRYSPATIIGAEKRPQFGNPVWERICTSHVERMNLTVRMTNRRHTRLTNAHSKSLKHHVAMQAILFAHYNFVRTHSTIKSTPAVAAGIADKVWTIRELLERAAEC